MPTSSLRHYLRRLLAPESVALVGVSERPGSLGRTLLENALEAGFNGRLYAVGNGRKALGQRLYRSLDAIDVPVDLAVIASPATELDRILKDGARRGVGCAVVLAEAPRGSLESRTQWARELAALAARRGIRLLGPGAFGVLRPAIGLNASVAASRLLTGRLALVAQSGAVTAAMLDFAAPIGLGFSSVLSIGDGIDVHVGEVLDALVADPQTDGIVLYLETVRNARRFLSALRAAARIKPVIVLKAGRSLEPPGAALWHPDDVFDAALRRAGTVRVETYTQLFAAARILSLGRIPRGDRLAIVASGRGPALLASDAAQVRGVPLATLAGPTRARLEPMAIDLAWTHNPIALSGEESPSRFGEAVQAVLDDPGVDAVVALHVPRPPIGSTDVARSVAAVARQARKPVLGAWLGAIDPVEIREALEAGGIANFYTPEIAVDAFAFLAAYRRNQVLLLEVPSPQPLPDPPDLKAAEAVRIAAQARGQATLAPEPTRKLLDAFGIGTLPTRTVRSVDEAKKCARLLGYPVVLEPADEPLAWPERRRPLAGAREVARAFEQLREDVQQRQGGSRALRVRKLAESAPRTCLWVRADPVFGPVIAIQTAASSGEPFLTLPPLNATLARNVVGQAWPARSDEDEDASVRRDVLVEHLVRISTLVCALPWVVSLQLVPVSRPGTHALCAEARVEVAPAREAGTAYAHMAIHPYPAELVEHIVARNGRAVTLRPIRPEDAAIEQHFVAGLSDQTRYFRFFYNMHELTPSMLARFTQVDYDREMALIATVDDASVDGGVVQVGVARYVENPDPLVAEYAIVVADAWQGEGIGRVLMERLIAAARRKGLERLEGTVLKENTHMLAFVARMGFAVEPDPEDPDVMKTGLDLLVPAPRYTRRVNIPEGRP